MFLAFTREVPRSINQCALSHLARAPIDVARARAEHARLEEALRALGMEVRRLPELPDLPDSVFVEDTAIVLDDLAVLARPGATSRRDEVAAMEDVLGPLRQIRRIESPGTLDGGDVLVLDHELVVGLSERTNRAGIAQLRACTEAAGYTVRAVEVRDCLHLKSAVTRVGAHTLVINPAWIDAKSFRGWETVSVHADEPFGANALLVNATVIYPQEHPRTRARLESAGCEVRPVPAGELAKAEGGVTCCALLLAE